MTDQWLMTILMNEWIKNTYTWCERYGLQRIVTLSTAEAEYISMAEGVKQLLYYKKLNQEVNICSRSIAMTKTACDFKRSKHIDVRYKFINELVESGDRIIRYIKSEDG